MFPIAKVRILKGNDDSRDRSVSMFTMFSLAKRQKGQTVSAADDCKTQVKVHMLTDFLARLIHIGGCTFAAGTPCRAP